MAEKLNNNQIDKHDDLLDSHTESVNDVAPPDGVPKNTGAEEKSSAYQSEAPSAAASGKAVSERKRAANKRNAQHATGPTTAAGKARSRGNAVKHGLLCTVVLVSDEDGNESRKDFDRLYRVIFDHYQPDDDYQCFLVERLATYYWLERRRVIAERGLIAYALVQRRHKIEEEPDTSVDVLPREWYSPKRRPRPEFERKSERYALKDHLAVPLDSKGANLLRYSTANQRAIQKTREELDAAKQRGLRNHTVTTGASTESAGQCNTRKGRKRQR